MSLTDVSTLMEIFNDEWHADFQQYANLFSRQAGDIEFAAPTYALLGDRTSSWRGFIGFRSTRWFLCLCDTRWNVGRPMDPDCLLDLIHWQPKS